MDWSTVANLILAIGLPAAEKIIALWEAKAAVTLAEFQAIRDMAKQTAVDRMTLQLNAAGVALDSEAAQKLLALVAGTAPPSPAPVVPPTPPAP